MSDIYLKTRIYSKDDAAKFLQSMNKKNILIVCDKFLAENKAVSYLTKNIKRTNQVVLFDQAIPDPTIEVLAKGVALLMQNKADVVIGFGGGSAIDTAKGIIYVAKQKNIIERPLFVTVPTTSGTGSEVTNAAVISDPKTQTKTPVMDEMILADVALLEPKLTATIPKSVTANTGIDVFTHALEAYIATGANAISDAFAEKAVELVMKSLLTCYKHGDDLNARSDMHIASTMAGMAFNTAGLGINHCMAHQLGAAFHIPHGLANALLLQEVIEFNAKDENVKRRYAKLAYNVHLVTDENSLEVAITTLKIFVEQLMHYMEMPCNIKECKVEKKTYEEQIDHMISYALRDNCYKSAPCKITKDEMKYIFQKIYA